MAGMVSGLSEPSRLSGGPSMTAMETSPAASLNAGEEVDLVGRAQCGTKPGHPFMLETSKLRGTLLAILARGRFRYF